MRRRGAGTTPLAPEMRFGMLTLLEMEQRKGRRYWRCTCDCGAECVVEESHLKSGHTRSCGCYRREAPKERRLDLTGHRYGRLLVLGPAQTKEGDAEGVYWDCVCDCGKRCICHKENLRAGNTRSCGCMQKEQRKKNMKTAIHFVDGTCVERIASQRTYANNTSGHRGVYRRENNRWRASIGFQGKMYNLGSFDRYEDAVEARLKAEQELYTPFLEQYGRERKESGKSHTN